MAKEKRKEKQVQTSSSGFECMNSCRKHSGGHGGDGSRRPFHKQLCISASSSPSSVSSVSDEHEDNNREEGPKTTKETAQPTEMQKKNSSAASQDAVDPKSDDIIAVEKEPDNKDGVQQSNTTKVSSPSASQASSSSSPGRVLADASVSTPSTSSPSSSVSHNTDATVINVELGDDEQKPMKPTDVSSDHDSASEGAMMISSESDTDINRSPDSDTHIIVAVVENDTSSTKDITIDNSFSNSEQNVEMSNNDFKAKCECGICHQKYKDPRLLPCLHTFCFECLKKVEVFLLNNQNPPSKPTKRSLLFTSPSRLMGNSSRRSISCPECDMELELPKAGVWDLPRNYIIYNRQTDDFMKQSDDVTLLCDLCTSKTKATFRCLDCVLNLCAFCCEAHKRQKRTDDHVVLNIDDARLRDINNMQRSVYCLSHPSEEVRMFCETCDKTICRDCGVTDHKEHKFAYINSVSERQITVIKNLLLQTKPHMSLLKITLTKLVEMRRKVYERVKDCEIDINKFIEGYMNAVNKHHQGLLDTVNSLKDGKDNALRVQGILLEQILTDLQHTCSVVEDVHAGCTSPHPPHSAPHPAHSAPQPHTGLRPPHTHSPTTYYL